MVRGDDHMKKLVLILLCLALLLAALVVDVQWNTPARS
jgi:hypothetical protein